VSNKISRLKKKTAAVPGLDWFIPALGAVVLIAWVWPVPGVGKGPFSMSAIANYGVSLIFFFYGLRLSLPKLLRGLANWQLHLVVHFSTFVLFPVLVLVGYQLFAMESSRNLWLGTFYLAAVPSTVSTSVVMVSIARGNFTAAVFNASISSVLGVFITPLWMSLFLSTSQADFDLVSTIGKLVIMVLLPIIAGMVLMPTPLGRFAETHRKPMTYFDQSVVILIVYTAFCEAFVQKSFEGIGGARIVFLTFALTGFFFLVYMIIGLICRILRFNREDSIAAQFCGSKKSLMQGTAMAKVLFHDPASIGVILLPLMIYHAMQIIIVSMIARAMAAKYDAEHAKTDRD